MWHTLLLWVDTHPETAKYPGRAFFILQEKLDVEKCKQVFPYGLPIVEVRSLGALGQQSQGRQCG